MNVDSFANWLNHLWCWIKDGWPSDYLPPIIALVGFFWSIWTYRSAKKRESYKLGLDLILKLNDRFDSGEMRQHRSTAAKALLEKTETVNRSVDTVFDFFEDVGFLLRRSAIDIDAIEEFFSYWVESYFCASIKYRAKRERDGVWSNFAMVGERLQRFEDRKNFSVYFRSLHYFAWHFWRKHKAIYRWNECDEDVDDILREETQWGNDPPIIQLKSPMRQRMKKYDWKKFRRRF